MPEAHHERLSQLDNSFLVIEEALPEAAMHIASTQIHEAGPLRNETGVDLTYLGHTLTWRDSGVPVSHTFDNSGGVLTFDAFPIVPAGDQVVLDIRSQLGAEPFQPFAYLGWQGRVVHPVRRRHRHFHCRHHETPFINAPLAGRNGGGLRTSASWRSLQAARERSVDTDIPPAGNSCQ